MCPAEHPLTRTILTAFGSPTLSPVGERVFERAARSALDLPIHLSNSQRSAGPVGRGWVPLVCFPLPEKVRGAERRQAPVRIAAPSDPPCGRVHLRIARDDRPVTQAGAPLGALPRRFPWTDAIVSPIDPRHRRRAAHFGSAGCSLLSIPRGRATVSAPFQGRASATAKDRALPSASSWQEAVVPPGGTPTPPECRLRAGSAGAAPARGPELPGAGCRSEDLFSGPPPACSTLKTPHECAPQRAG